jgi:hypothetical protein
VRRLVSVVAGIALAVAMLASQSTVANAASISGRVTGAGTSVMTDGMGTTAFALDATLYANGSARGYVICLDEVGSAPGYPGVIYGPVTSWTRDVKGIVTLHGVAKVVSFENGAVLSGVPFTVSVQKSGGAGVGHWTMEIPGVTGPTGGPICVELLTSGTITVRWNRDHEGDSSFEDN